MVKRPPPPSLDDVDRLLALDPIGWQWVAPPVADDHVRVSDVVRETFGTAWVPLDAIVLPALGRLGFTLRLLDPATRGLVLEAAHADLANAPGAVGLHPTSPYGLAIRRTRREELIAALVAVNGDHERPYVPTRAAWSIVYGTSPGSS